MKNITLSILILAVCSQLSAQTLSGTILASTDSVLCNVNVLLLDTNEVVLQQTTTDENGKYFIDLPDANESYLLRVAKEGEEEVRNGLSAMDIVSISRHLLGMNMVEDNRLISALDVNLNNGVSTFDIVTIRKVLLGIDATFTAPNWQFYNTETSNSQSSNTFELNGRTVLNLTGYKTADFNQDAQACP